MDTVENTVTSNSNTVLSSGVVKNGNGYVDIIDENQPYSSSINSGDIPSNYTLENLTLDSSSILHSSTTATTNGNILPTIIDPHQNNDKTELNSTTTTTICGENSMATMSEVNDETVISDSNNNDSAYNNRRARFKYTKLQLKRFEEYFRSNMFPDSVVREEISKELNIPVRNVQVWFKNRRAKHRKSAQIETYGPSFLENSTLLPTPDNQSNNFCSFNHSSYCGSTPITTQHHISSHSTPQHPIMMMNFYQSHQSAPSSTNTRYITSSNGGAYYVNPMTGQLQSAITLLPVNPNNINNNSTNFTPNSNPVRIQNASSYSTNNANQHNIIPLPTASVYRTDDNTEIVSPNVHSDNPSSSSSTKNNNPFGGYSTAASTNQTQIAPLTNNPFISNLPPTSYYHHTQQPLHHYNTQQYRSHRSLYYRETTPLPLPNMNNMTPLHLDQNENISNQKFTTNQCQSKHEPRSHSKENHRTDNNQNRKNTQKLSEFLPESYLNR